MIIKLDKLLFIAEGIYCKCYEEPSNKHECIKIPIEGKKANKRLKADLNYYAKLHKRKVDLSNVADYLGECETTMGKGYVYECVRDYDLTVSRRLQYYLDSNEIEKELLYTNMEKLAQYLLDNKILISDIHARNILIQINANNEIKPVIVDGIGDRVAIELLNIWPGVEEAKIIRRWNRFAQKELNGHALLASDL